MIVGAHLMLQSRNEKADKAFFTDVLKLSSIDAGDGFLIFGLPPSEVAVHESDKNGVHELILMCDDVEAFVAEMKRHDIAASPPANRGWGTLTEITLPGGGKLGVYQPHHKRPKATLAKTKKKSKVVARKSAKKVAKKVAKKKKAKKR